MLAFILFRLTLKGVWTDIPHDFGAVITYAFLLCFVGFIFLGGKSSAPPGDE